ncbi:unnamed protein product [Phytomonas sp. EM1]|nr:unnamed protein product [Phytomonas sp. EM1]|eukprot:CCW63511.1 unnamed protein product [Phytomonas sp. isolate EM1]
MRGFLGRNNADKLQPVSNITSYEEALYPPRPYRYHLQQDSIVPSTSLTASPSPNASHSASSPPPLVVLPSIDADSICEPHSQQSQAQQHLQTRRPTGTIPGASASSGAAVNKRPPPCLSKFFDCYVPSPLEMDERALFDVLGGPQSSWCEPLNIFHYTNLIFEGPPCLRDNDVKLSVGNLADNKGIGTRPDSSVTMERQQTALLRFADVARVPPELRSFVMAIGTGGLITLRPGAGKSHSKNDALNVLRIRASRRPRPPRPIRRGAKVMLDTDNAATSISSRVDGRFGKLTADGVAVGKKRPRSGEEGPDGKNLADMEHDNDSDDSQHSANVEEDDDDDANNLSDGFYAADDDDYGDNAKDGFNDENDNDFF